MTFFGGLLNEKHVPSFVDFLYIIKLEPPTKHAIVGPHVKPESSRNNAVRRCIFMIRGTTLL